MVGGESERTCISLIDVYGIERKYREYGGGERERKNVYTVTAFVNLNIYKL